MLISLNHTTPLLQKYTSPEMLKSKKHSSLHSSELENMRKNNDMVKNTHLPNNCAHSVYAVILQKWEQPS